MKLNNKIIFTVLIIISLVIMIFIYFSNQKKDIEIMIINAKENLYVGDTLKLDVKIKNSENNQYKVKWDSSNKEVVEIDENGFIVAKAKGTSQITAIYTDENNYDVIDSISIVVLLKEILPSEVYFENDYVGINLGIVYKLPLKIISENLSLNDIKYTSSNNNCVTVSNNGTITGLKYGKSTITMSSLSGTIIDKIEVIVSNEYSQPVLMNEPKKLNFNYNEVLIYEGESLKLDYTTEPSIVFDDLIEWSSGNSNIATVSDGVVTALNIGKSIISATLSNGDSSFVIVEVVRKENINFKVVPETILLKKGDSLNLNIQGIQDEEVSYKILDNSIAIVSNNGVVKALKEGMTIISVTVNNVIKNVIVNVVSNDVYNQNIDNNNQNSESISLLLKSSNNNLRGSYDKIISSNKGMMVGIHSVVGVNNISKVEYCVYTYGENECNSFTQINDIKSDFYVFNSTGKYSLRMKVIDDKNNVIYKTYYVSIKNSIIDNSNNDATGGIDSTCGKKAQVLTAYVNGKQIPRYEKFTISVGETLTINLHLPKNFGTIKQLTRTTADGQEGWNNYLSGNSVPYVNRYDASTYLERDNFDWVIVGKKNTNGKYIHLSETTFQSTSKFSEIKSFFNVYVKVVD